MGFTEGVAAIVGGDGALVIESSDKRSLGLDGADGHEGCQQGKDKFFHCFEIVLAASYLPNSA